MATKTVLTKYSDLKQSLKELINHQIEAEFGEVPIVKMYTWADPVWTVFMMNENGKVLTFFNIVERICKFDEEPIKIAGISNLITPPEHRGMGYGSKIMDQASGILFEDVNAECGLLLCADELIPFYNRFGWYTIDGHVTFVQPDGKKVWQANTMLLSRDHNRYHPGTIDLCGLPW